MTHLGVAVNDGGDTRGLASLALRPRLLLRAHQVPQLVDVHRRAVVLVALQVEVTHTDLAEVTRMAASYNTQ